jgi:hypothetical protein
MTFDGKADFGSVMPILSVDVRRCRPIGWVCKPEVTGSIPVRSISRKSRFADAFLRAVPTLASGQMTEMLDERTADCSGRKSRAFGGAAVLRDHGVMYEAD